MKSQKAGEEKELQENQRLNAPFRAALSNTTAALLLLTMRKAPFIPLSIS